jgi:hypothetical protein
MPRISTFKKSSFKEDYSSSDHSSNKNSYSREKDPNYLDDLLYDWRTVKNKISNLNKDEEDLKYKINKILDNEEKDSISSKNFKVSRKTTSKFILGKKDIPEGLWDKYSKKISYSVLYLKKIT